MNHERLHIRHIGKQREQLQMIDEVFCGLLVSLDLERKDRTAAVRELFFVECLLHRILRYRRMMHLLHLRVVVQIFYDL